ncbi:MAG: hypothetical protein JNL71_12140 [Rhodospirillales bacterium]|nr:hypothetical protein [Rhodospirillales bacterium]
MTRLEILRRAMLPLDGTIADWVPGIMDAYARIVPMRDWPKITMVDFTAGSCLMPTLFAASGVRRLVVNDFAPRSHLAASFLFGRRRIDAARVSALLAAKRPKLRAHVPTFHFACDYLVEPACDVFDRLYHADVPAAERTGLQYLAVRWALGFAKSVEDGFEILYTHDPARLARMRDVDWTAYLARARRPGPVLAQLVKELNAAIDAIGPAKARLRCADMKDVAKGLKLSTPVFAAVNPPTRGLDEYTIDDQLVHSLMANRWLPLSQTSETPLAFWTRRVDAGLRHLPSGAHYMVWGGDGSMRWSECLRVWSLYGTPLHVSRLGENPESPGWAIFRKQPK